VSAVAVLIDVAAGDCDCPAEPSDDGLCAHAVAVSLAAFEDGLRFAAAGVPHGEDTAEPGRADLRRAAESLNPRDLTELVIDQALRDPEFAALLLEAVEGRPDL
jgi:uncharacterized Zn finger protein